MNSLIGFKTVSFSLLGGLVIRVGKNTNGFFYEIQDSFLVGDAKDNLSEGFLFEAVSCALNPSFENDFLSLIKTL